MRDCARRSLPSVSGSWGTGSASSPVGSRDAAVDVVNLQHQRLVIPERAESTFVALLDATQFEQGIRAHDRSESAAIVDPVARGAHAPAFLWGRHDARDHCSLARQGNATCQVRNKPPSA
jgi:hypothetical protein